MLRVYAVNRYIFINCCVSTHFYTYFAKLQKNKLYFTPKNSALGARNSAAKELSLIAETDAIAIFLVLFCFFRYPFSSGTCSRLNWLYLSVSDHTLNITLTGLIEFHQSS